MSAVCLISRGNYCSLCRDPRLIPLILNAAERFREITKLEQEELMESAASLTPLFPMKR